MIPVVPPIPVKAIAVAVTVLALVGSAWYVISGLREADRREIEQLAEVANRNAKAAEQERRNAAHYAEVVQAAGKQHEEREQALQASLRALREANDENVDSGDCVPGSVRLRWDAGEDGDRDQAPDVSG